MKKKILKLQLINYILTLTKYITFFFYLMKKFQIQSPYKPSGDQPSAIKKIIEGLKNKSKDQVLLGVTGSGKTFTIANVINKVQNLHLYLLLIKY